MKHDAAAPKLVVASIICRLNHWITKIEESKHSFPETLTRSFCWGQVLRQNRKSSQQRCSCWSPKKIDSAKWMTTDYWCNAILWSMLRCYIHIPDLLLNDSKSQHMSWPAGSSKWHPDVDAYRPISGPTSKTVTSVFKRHSTSRNHEVQTSLKDCCCHVPQPPKRLESGSIFCFFLKLSIGHRDSEIFN